MNKRRGISLIVLVITILVMLILSGVVIVSLSKNNPIEKAKEARFKSNMLAYIDESNLTSASNVANEVKNVNVNIGEMKNNKFKIQEIIPSMIIQDANRLGIFESKLCYLPERFTKQECKWLQEIGAVPQIYGSELILENVDYSKIDSIGVEGITTEKEELYYYPEAVISKHLNENGEEIRREKDVGEITNYIKVIPGKKYYYYFKEQNNAKDMYGVFYDENKVVMRETVFPSMAHGQEIVAPQGAKYLRISYPGQIDYISVKIQDEDSKMLLEYPKQIENLNNFKIGTVNRNLIDYQYIKKDLARIYADKYKVEDILNGFSLTCLKDFTGLIIADSNDIRLADNKLYKMSYNYTDRITEYREVVNINMPNHLVSINRVELVNDKDKKQIREIIKPMSQISDVRWRWFATISGDIKDSKGEYSNFMLYEIPEENKNMEIPYVKHQSSNVNIKSYLNGFKNGPKDTLYFQNGKKEAKIERKIDKIVLTGNENFEIEKSNSKYTIFTTKDFDTRLAKYKESYNENVICNRFNTTSYDKMVSLNDNGIAIYDNNKGKIKICIDNSVASSVSEFKNFLKTHNIDVYIERNRYAIEKIVLENGLDFYDNYTRIHHTGVSSNIVTVLK